MNKSPYTKAENSLGHSLDTNGQILGHVSAFNGVHAHLFERGTEFGQGFIVVQLGTVGQTSRPGIDGG